PASNIHLLFDLIDPGTDKQAVFLKMELAPPFSVKHAKDWVESWLRLGVAGANEGPGQCKERVPSEEMSRFTCIVNAVISSKNFHEQFEKLQKSHPKNLVIISTSITYPLTGRVTSMFTSAQQAIQVSSEAIERASIKGLSYMQ